MADDDNKIIKPKGIEKAKARAERANAAGDAVEAKASGKSPGKLTRREMKAGRGLGKKGKG